MPISITKPHRAVALAELDALRDEFRATIATAKRPAAFSSRVGVVLSGGGARGAYEAGVLMAFQDAFPLTSLRLLPLAASMLPPSPPIPKD